MREISFSDNQKKRWELVFLCSILPSCEIKCLWCSGEHREHKFRTIDHASKHLNRTIPAYSIGEEADSMNCAAVLLCCCVRVCVCFVHRLKHRNVCAAFSGISIEHMCRALSHQPFYFTRCYGLAFHIHTKQGKIPAERLEISSIRHYSSYWISYRNAVISLLRFAMTISFVFQLLNLNDNFLFLSLGIIIKSK